MKREEAYNRIDAIIAKYEIDDEYVTITNSKDYDALRIARKALEQEPSNDMVSRGVFEQVMWERNIAIEQLKELGYGFGEEIRTDGDTISRQKTIEAFEKWICSDYKDDYPIMSFIGIQAILEEQPSVKLKESSEDAISRQAVLEVIKNYASMLWEKYREPFPESTIMEIIQELPSVTPKPKTGWIPVNERLPEENMACLVTVGKFNLIKMAMYSDLMGTIDHRIFYQGLYGDENFGDITQYVKAWMPLPEPYKGE